ncbi:MAG: hypothetical protein LBL07_09095 [Tannerella sp.]|jgi:hypothetical protein|nr:hypothetical protein [Tannerella sp.]
MFASFGNVFSEESCASESMAMPENIPGHFKKEKGHAPVYIFDRGLSSSQKPGCLKAEKGLLFVGRLIENRKLKVLENLSFEESVFTQGELLQDSPAQIYGYEESVSRNGKPVSR